MAEETSIDVVKDVCGVDEARARELLEAGGNTQRAIDIHLSAVAGDNAKVVEVNQTLPQGGDSVLKRKAQQQPASKTKSPQKQAKLSSFFTGVKSNGMEAESVLPDVRVSEPYKYLEDGVVTAKITSQSETEERKGGSRATPSVASNKNFEDSRLHYAVLAEAFSEMAGTTKRLVKIEALKTALLKVIEAVGGIDRDTKSDRLLDGETLLHSVELILPGTMTIQVSGSLVSKVVRTVTGASSSRLRDAYRETGDLGDAAERFVRNQSLLIQPKPLTINNVHSILCSIAAQQGKNSQSLRHELMAKMLRSCRRNEMRFLVRTLLGNMRLGANLRTVIVALAQAVVSVSGGSEAEVPLAAKDIQETFDICPRWDRITHALLCGGIPYMKKTCVLEVGTPVNPMLANPAHSFDEVRKLMAPTEGLEEKEAVVEYKYDGVRCQAHFNGKEVRLFSRNMLENTEQYPDVVNALFDARLRTVESFIVDGEIVAVETSNSGEENDIRLLPFQDLSTRSGAVPGSSSNPVQVRLYAFDLIFLNGKSMIRQPMWKRQETLREHFKETTWFAFASSLTLSSFEEGTLSKFLGDAVKQGAEGLMVKLSGRASSASIFKSDVNKDEGICWYESGTRSQTWLKVKRDYVAGFSDTIDVVPIGAWYGNGRKAQKGFLSPVLLAVYDEDEEVFRSISRCMSFSDAMYEAMRAFYVLGTPYPDGVGLGLIDAVDDTTASIVDNNEAAASDDEGDDSPRVDGEVKGVNCYSERPPALIETNESPPIWFKPMEVFEVAFADLSLSRAHKAAVGMIEADSSRGVALRFPRFIRRRPDKNVEQATSSQQIVQLFANQSKQRRKAPT